ncbi:hypothetical protein H1230_25025 [Paenibacillus sp. 19GGS1-52]|uniref:hypothetical protein n=1 Tax=Paenibacillus sp. 19GGS1-52 TaxID=2758563 RepID=UPI001EFBDA62|nr:hypothetical protein [Paenibacillus sp. 19GGS1-52]ULO06252.1 hypothetical protein H1230_25025 [Paenibacillus sp. 19GGS1-52]
MKKDSKALKNANEKDAAVCKRESKVKKKKKGKIHFTYVPRKEAYTEQELKQLIVKEEQFLDFVVEHCLSNTNR